MMRFRFELEGPDPLSTWWLGHLDRRWETVGVTHNDTHHLVFDYDGEVVFEVDTEWDDNLSFM